MLCYSDECDGDTLSNTGLINYHIIDINPCDVDIYDVTMPVPNWRWYHVFRKWPLPQLLLISLLAISPIRRIQEKLSRVVRSKQKRRMYIHKLYNS